MGKDNRMASLAVNWCATIVHYDNWLVENTFIVNLAFYIYLSFSYCFLTLKKKPQHHSSRNAPPVKEVTMKEQVRKISGRYQKCELHYLFLRNSKIASAVACGCSI